MKEQKKKEKIHLFFTIFSKAKSLFYKTLHTKFHCKEIFKLKYMVEFSLIQKFKNEPLLFEKKIRIKCCP